MLDFVQGRIVYAVISSSGSSGIGDSFPALL